MVSEQLSGPKGCGEFSEGKCLFWKDRGSGDIWVDPGREASSIRVARQNCRLMTKTLRDNGHSELARPWWRPSTGWPKHENGSKWSTNGFGAHYFSYPDYDSQTVKAFEHGLQRFLPEFVSIKFWTRTKTRSGGVYFVDSSSGGSKSGSKEKFVPISTICVGSGNQD